MQKYLAQTEIPIKGTFQTPGNLGNAGTNAGNLFTSVLSGAIGLLTVIAGIWFIFLLITGAIGIMTSGGDKQAAEGAKKRITNALIGLLIVVAGIFIVDFVGGLLGLNILDPLLIINAFP
jgi:hypothetical protein